MEKCPICRLLRVSRVQICENRHKPIHRKSYELLRLALVVVWDFGGSKFDSVHCCTYKVSPCNGNDFTGSKIELSSRVKGRELSVWISGGCHSTRNKSGTLGF